MKKQNKKISKKVASSRNTAYTQTKRDFKDALLILSVTANVYILCLWVALQATSRYDASLVAFFFNR